MTDNKQSSRIPFEEIDSASSSAWDFPSWDEGAKVIPSVKRRGAEEEKTDAGRVEDVEDDEQHSIAPITAAQLQQISEEAEREGREHGYKQGYEQGFGEGEKKGLKLGEQKAYAEVKQRLEDQRERFVQLADALLDPIAMQDSGLENLVLDMAVHFAKHLINKELTEDPSSLFDIVKRAAASLPAGAQNVRIYLHADDVELANEAFASSGQDWTFYSDAQLSRGGCRIESSESLIDFSIEQRLQQMLEEVSFQGEIDPESVAPVGDYRPAEADSAPPAQGSAAEDVTAGNAESGKPNVEDSVTDEPAAKRTSDTSTPNADAEDLEPGASTEKTQPPADASAEASNDTVGTSGAGDNVEQKRPTFGNQWDGRRE